MAKSDGGGNGWSQIKATATISLIQLAIFYGLFECWRGREKYRSIYLRRLPNKAHRTPSQPSAKPFGWLGAIAAVDDAETVKDVGLDTYVFLRFLKLGIAVTVPGAILACIALIPVYVTVPGVSGSNFKDLSASVVPKGDDRLWAPFFFTYVFCLYVLFLMYKEAQHFLPLRKDFLARGDADTPADFQLTAVVENVPADCRSSHALLELLNTNGQVVSASLCLHTEHLDKLIAERQKAIEKIEQATAKKTFKPEKGEPTTKIGGAIPMCCGHKVDTIAHFEGELRRLNSEIDEEYRDISAVSSRMDHSTPELLVEASRSGKGGIPKLPFGGNKDETKIGEDVPAVALSDEQIAAKWNSLSSATGFVKFNSLAAKQEAMQTKYPNKMTVLPAPEPDDVIWSNLTVTTSAQRTKRIPVNLLWTLGIMFWVVPITFIASISNLETLSTQLPWLAKILPPANSFVYGLLAGYLPVIMLLVFMMLIPIVIFKSATSIIRYKALSQADRYTLVWHFGFQVANLFLIVLAGSVFNQIDSIINDPMSFPALLAAGIPTQATYFINLTITVTCTGLMLELSQLVGIIINVYILGSITKPDSLSQRQLEAAKVPAPLKWGWIYPSIIFQWLVALVYSAITPIVLLFTAAYFVIVHAVYRNNCLYIYAQANEGGGATFYPLYGMLMGCLYINELMMVAWLGLKQGSVQSPLLIPLVVITIIGDCMIRKRFLTPSKSLTVEEAQRVDKGQPLSDMAAGTADGNAKAAPPTTVEGSPSSMLYKQPALKPEEWETEPQPYRTNPSAQDV